MIYSNAIFNHIFSQQAFEFLGVQLLSIFCHHQKYIVTHTYLCKTLFQNNGMDTFLKAKSNTNLITLVTRFILTAHIISHFCLLL